MPTKKQQVAQTAGIAKATEIPRFQLDAIGNSGLLMSAGVPFDSVTLRELQFPQSLDTYLRMGMDSSIASALNLFTMMIARSQWDVKMPKDARNQAGSEEDVAFLKSVMQDMDSPWSAFLQEVSSKIQYGFSVHEKVYRKRLRSKGSRFNDGKIGLKKMPVRSQTSIQKFIYQDDELIGIQQNLSHVNAWSSYSDSPPRGQVTLPRSKVLLFRTGTQRDNPVGRSPLMSVFFDWKYRCAIQENESIGAARDLGGIPVVHIPPQYMSANATPEQKAVYEEYKKIVRNISSGNQSGLVLPQAYDEGKNKLFDFKLLSIDGSKLFDTNEIINRYDRKILTTLMSDLLIMGQSSTGSYSLGTIKSELVNIAVETHLQEIADVLNKDLVPQLFNLNGIYRDYYPEFYFGDLSATDLDLFSKYIQRCASTSMIVKDIDTLNKVRNVMGIDDLPEDFDLAGWLAQNDKMTSKAGKGFETPFNGTSTGNASNADASVNNLENA